MNLARLFSYTRFLEEQLAAERKQHRRELDNLMGAHSVHASELQNELIWSEERRVQDLDDLAALYERQIIELVSVYENHIATFRHEIEEHRTEYRRAYDRAIQKSGGMPIFEPTPPMRETSEDDELRGLSNRERAVALGKRRAQKVRENLKTEVVQFARKKELEAQEAKRKENGDAAAAGE